MKGFGTTFLTVHFCGKSLRNVGFLRIQVMPQNYEVHRTGAEARIDLKIFLGNFSLHSAVRRRRYHVDVMGTASAFAVSHFWLEFRGRNPQKWLKNEEVPPVRGLYVKCAIADRVTNFFGNSLGSFRVTKKKIE